MTSSESRSTPSISISSDGRDDPPLVFDAKVSAGEDGGAARIWVANHLFQRDPIARAAHALATSKRMNVALMAMNPFTMHPAQMAMAAATLDEFHPGRVTLCLGSGSPADLESLSIPADKPLKPMREALQVLRALLSGETVKSDGESFPVRSRALSTGARRVHRTDS